jgi:hypothetical protein
MKEFYRSIQNTIFCVFGLRILEGSGTHSTLGVIIYFNTGCHYPVVIKELGHLLTRSGLKHPEVSTVVFLGSFCLLECSIILTTWVYIGYIDIL